MKNITLLGATGSIGQQTLAVIRENLDKFRPFALTAKKNYSLLAKQCQEFNPAYAVIEEAEMASELKALLPKNTELLVGKEKLIQVASDKNVASVMAAIVGAAGLLPTLNAAEAGKTILLANKEALIMSGKLFIETCQKNQVKLFPVDSEHSAIYQCLASRADPIKTQQIQEIILTASGGPFRHTPLNEFHHITPEQACKHPNWSMGQKISVDSATMFNKALEVIEAHWLFNLPPEKIKVLVHPQSIIHSMVSFIDGSTMAQLGRPDMRTPIAYAMESGGRIVSGVSALNWSEISQLDFEPVDPERFPSINLAYQVLEAGGTAPAILNAANEVAVEAFLNQRLNFPSIFNVVEETLNRLPITPADTIEQILQADGAARRMARTVCGEAL